MTNHLPERLLELAERVEAAMGPDRELDFYIWAALNGVTEITDPAEGRDANGEWHLYGFVDPYTASLDAAMTLVPEGQEFGCGSKDATGTAWAWAGQHNGPEEIASAATPALALCAAALRAQSQRGDRQG